MSALRKLKPVEAESLQPKQPEQLRLFDLGEIESIKPHSLSHLQNSALEVEAFLLAVKHKKLTGEHRKSALRLIHKIGLALQDSVDAV
jgi:hypothetical protein